MIWYLLIGVVLVLGYQLHAIHEVEETWKGSFKNLYDCFFDSKDEFHSLYLVVTILCIIGWPFAGLYIISVEMQKRNITKGR